VRNEIYFSAVTTGPNYIDPSAGFAASNAPQAVTTDDIENDKENVTLDMKLEITDG